MERVGAARKALGLGLGGVVGQNAQFHPIWSHTQFSGGGILRIGRGHF